MTTADRRQLDAAASDPADAHRQCEELLRRELGSAAVLLTTSCSAALEAVALLLDVGPGDEVVLPSFTHPGTANAFAQRGARLVFCDLRPDTCNLDEALVAAALGPATRAVVAVHYGGVACAVDRLLELTAARGVELVEDAAHGLFASWRGRPLGSFGRLAVTSFDRTKNISCDKGGALVVNDPALVAAAVETVDAGTDRRAFSRGEVDRYSWQRVGLNAALAEPLAALLLAELGRRQAIQQRREELSRRYADELAAWAAARGVALPRLPAGAVSNHHLFALRLPTEVERDRFIRHMAARGVAVTTHFEPLHLSPVGRRLGYRPGDLPVTEAVAATLVRLPLVNDLADVEQQRIVAAVLDF